MSETRALPSGRYFLVCECGSAEEVGAPAGRCEGCGAEYKLRDSDVFKQEERRRADQT